MIAEEVIKSLEVLGAKKVKIAVADIDGILRGKVMNIDKFKGLLDSPFGFCNVIFGWDCNDKAYDNSTFSGWHTGYPDIDAFVDFNTYRHIPWDHEHAFFIADFSGRQLDQPNANVCPRTLLKRIKNELETEFGFSAKFSQEFEWFNFDESPQSLAEKNYVSPTPITPGMFGYSILRTTQKTEFFNDLFDMLKEFKIPLEGLHTETGPGVYEAAICYSDILEAADRATLFKTGVKEIANRHGIMASFMAKWNKNLPGCSGHIHQSLWEENKNLFYTAEDGNNMSELFKSYIAGCLHCLPHILPMFAPNINSYKRLVKGAWAPTNPTWGLDNRTVALRVLTGSENATRLEARVPGSDTNPYLAMAACLAGGMYGIKNKMKLDQAPTFGNGYDEKKYGRLSSGLKEATQKMKESEVAMELFGEEFVNHFVETREWECQQHKGAPENWEMKRYFEII